jgi:hypothetical protein
MLFYLAYVNDQVNGRITAAQGAECSSGQTAPTTGKPFALHTCDVHVDSGAARIACVLKERTTQLTAFLRDICVITAIQRCWPQSFLAVYPLAASTVPQHVY